jgi:dipeptidyl aminopeptidase/acylaminoacyl peptidase
MKIRCLVLIAVLGLCTLPAAERTHDISIDDGFSLAAVAELAIRPDGGQVAYCESRWSKPGQGRQNSIWIVSTAPGSAPRRISPDEGRMHSLRWSGDGTRLYCLAARQRAGETEPPWNGTTQIWQVSLQGGEMLPVTAVAGGVSRLAYASRADLLFYALNKVTVDEDDFSHLRRRFDQPRYAGGKRTVSEIWRLDPRRWQAQRVVDEKRYVRSFTASADGRRLAIISALDDSVVKSEGESRLDIWENGQVVTPPTAPYRVQAATPWAWLEAPAFSADGRKAAFCAVFDGHPVEIFIAQKSGSDWRVARMPRPASVHVHGFGQSLRWHPSGRLFFLAQISATTVVAPDDAAVLGQLAREPLPDRTVSAFDLDAAGRTGAYVIGSTDAFPEIFAGAFSPGAPFRRLTDLNPQTGNWRLPVVRRVTWQGADGVPVSGILELPWGHRPGTRLPLVVGIHGGPTAAVLSALDFNSSLGRTWLPARGYAVLCPNYRGSTGYGDRFLEELNGRENDLDVSDIVAGVQHLVGEGIADPERVGVMGWSNGGYLSNCLITRKDLPFRLRAASSGAGIIDTVLEWGSNDEPACHVALKLGTPWEVPDTYRRTSPTYGLGNVSVPTLIHVGENDERCPPANGRTLHRALKEYLGVPSEWIIYPGETHGLGKMESRRAKMEWDLAWFEKYLQ